MASQALRGEDYAGLALALVLHAGLIAGLVFQPLPTKRVAQPERISVTLSEDVGLTSTSPEPQTQAAPPAAPAIATEPEPAPITPPAPPPLPTARHELAPEPKALSRPRPVPVVTRAPRARPAPDIIADLAQRSQARRAIPRPPAASRVSDTFLKGVPGAQTRGMSQSPPAAAMGPAVQSALAGAISRQLKPHWAAPQGAEAERLVSVLAWSLNRDGTLAGSPRLARQEGITDANRAQAARHAEQAIRAVQLAAPFTLPSEHYSAWQRIASFRFDKRLSQ